jgi:uncharacterized protein (TIGR00375 family)
MEINCDLHAHSGYAGGVGKISLAKIDEMMVLKGIHIIGTGDCLHPGWITYLQETLKEGEDGIFTYEERKTKFILQTEIIITAEVEYGRKSVHTTVLFPSFDAAQQFCTIMEKWGVKNTIGRPFIVCDNSTDVSQRLYHLIEIDKGIEVIPAHVLTPDGIYGSNRPITYLHEFFGDFSSEIAAIETGLSADPGILTLIPELQGKTWISNSDAHSHHLHRMGREFTTVDVQKVKYSHVIEAIRKNNIVRTAEFHPAEGRYFLTGHRGSRKGHNGSYCYFSPQHVPEDHVCPICSKKLTIGVFERAVTLQKAQSHILKENRPRERKFVNMIPLVEIIARGLTIQSVTAKKVLKEYRNIVDLVESECDLWFMDAQTVEDLLKGTIADSILSGILTVKKGRFGFSPPGFDGEYGELVLDHSGDVTDMQELWLTRRQTAG